MPPVGLRSYLAVRGGIDVPPVLGSRSTDTLSGLGPAPLRAGDRLPVGDLRARSRSSTSPRCARRRPGRCCGCCPVRAATGWHPAAWTALTGAGVDGHRRQRPGRPAAERAAAGRARDDELPSEGLVPGAVQVPPDGAPVLFLADHPVTGGYPVLAVVATADLPAAAQLRPGGRGRGSAPRARVALRVTGRTGSTAGPDGPCTTSARAP